MTQYRPTTKEEFTSTLFHIPEFYARIKSVADQLEPETVKDFSSLVGNVKKLVNESPIADFFLAHEQQQIALIMKKLNTLQARVDAFNEFKRKR